jgi:hypothetical protein
MKIAFFGQFNEADYFLFLWKRKFNISVEGEISTPREMQASNSVWFIHK